jgi:hypothetical protein
VFVSNHVAVGGFVGLLLRRRPLLATTVGVASHFALDAIPHWGLDPARPDAAQAFWRIARTDGVLGATLLAGTLLAAPKKVAMAGALFGAVVPDLGHVTTRFWG